MTRLHSKSLTFWLAALIILVGIAAYHNSFSGDFLLDDSKRIVHNKAIRTVWPPWEAMFQPKEGRISGRPILNFSFAVNFALGRLNVWSYHAVNLFIHLLAALTLFEIVRRTLTLNERLRARYADRAAWLALAVSLIWMVHPLQTQSVTYIIQRAESMMGLFYLLTIYFSIRSFESERSAKWSALAVLFCAIFGKVHERILYKKLGRKGRR